MQREERARQIPFFRHASASSLPHRTLGVRTHVDRMLGDVVDQMRSRRAGLGRPAALCTAPTRRPSTLSRRADAYQLSVRHVHPGIIAAVGTCAIASERTSKQVF